MGDFLTAVKTVSLRFKPQTEEPAIRELPAPAPTSLVQSHHEEVDSPESALKILRSQPDTDALEDVLVYLSGRKSRDGFNIRIPSPFSAMIINELISTTIPDFWDGIDGLKALLLTCLRSVAGIGAVLSRLRLLVSQYKPSAGGADAERPILDMISVMSELLTGQDTSYGIWSDISFLVENQARQVLLWKEYLNYVASGKIISAVAQAEDITKLRTTLSEGLWLSNGSIYSAWLGTNIASMIRRPSSLNNAPSMKAAAQLCGKSFGIGYAARIVEEIHSRISLVEDIPLSTTKDFIRNLQNHEQRQFLELTMRFISSRNSGLSEVAPDFEDVSQNTPPSVSGAGALLSNMVGENRSLETQLTAWLSDPAGNANEPFAIRRAALSALASLGAVRSVLDEDPMQTVLENSWKLFGDNLFIKHTPIIQQEACSQILLMAAGYVHRKQPMFLFTLARSSLHLQGMSNRLNTSSPRARLLGMIVGIAISDLVDKEGSKLAFNISEVETPEARWLQRLTRIDDAVGSPEQMREVFSTEAGMLTNAKGGKKTSKMRKAQADQVAKKAKVETEIKGPRIMEVVDEDEDDDDLVPYSKPDSDPEDEDDDPTLVTRNKPKAPVYIRDLISALHDTENHDRHTLAIKAAASLIRRKSSFGKEVSDHAIELALVLTGLTDQFDLEDFQELRLQALISVLLSNPALLAPWFARQVFEGDYSLSQRATMLSVLGLGARETAGYKDEDEVLNPNINSTSFPSKQLPDRLHKIYSSEKDGRTGLIASRLEQSIIQPMALEAADNMSGPNVLKVRTFSSRMEVEKKRKKPIPNALAKIIAESFFFPLTGRWWQNMQAHGANNVHFQPFLLSTYLKTLAILLHASGPSTLSLPQMTGEFWQLLLSVRTNALAEFSVLEAALFCFLTLLEVNEDKRYLAEEHSKELMETQQWVELVFERCSGADEEGERVRMLSASVLVKTREVVEKYQRLLAGAMMDY